MNYLFIFLTIMSVFAIGGIIYVLLAKNLRVKK